MLSNSNKSSVERGGDNQTVTGDNVPNYCTAVAQTHDHSFNVGLYGVIVQ